MRTAWLIYSEEGLARNQWLAHHYLRTAEDLGWRLVLVVVEQLELSCDAPPRMAGKELPWPEFAIVRVIDPELRGYLAALGVNLVNSNQLASIANDKFLTALHCARAGIRVMPTRCGYAPQLMGQHANHSVLKSPHGHGGNEVAALPELAALPQWAEGARIITQPMCSTPGIDTRVYILGGEIVAAMKRSSSLDFRSNFTKGGTAERVHLGADELEIVQSVLGSLGAISGTHLSRSYFGIDLIYHEGMPVLNEIEDVVGARMLYTLTDIDIIAAQLQLLCVSSGENTA